MNGTHVKVEKFSLLCDHLSVFSLGFHTFRKLVMSIPETMAVSVSIKYFYVL